MSVGSARKTQLLVGLLVVFALFLERNRFRLPLINEIFLELRDKKYISEKIYITHARGFDQLTIGALDLDPSLGANVAENPPVREYVH